MGASKKTETSLEGLQSDLVSDFTHDDFWYFEDSWNKSHADPFKDGYAQGQKDLAKLIMETFKEHEVPLMLWEALKEY